jgi:tetratricopeptide (TPR) repeat protein
MIKKACKIEPDNGAYLDSLGWAYYKMGDYKNAKKYLEKAVKLEKDPEIYEHLGYLYFQLKDYEKSILYFSKVYEQTGKKEIQEMIEKAKIMLKNEITGKDKR